VNFQDDFEEAVEENSDLLERLADADLGGDAGQKISEWASTALEEVEDA